MPHALPNRPTRKLSLLPIMILLAACSSQPPLPSKPTASTPTSSPTAPPTPTSSPTPTPTPTKTHTPTTTPTQTPSSTPTVTPTSSITPSLTPDSPVGHIVMQANCRYGPGQAYLYAHGLYAGDQVAIDGRNYSGTWLWVKPGDLDWHCWASATVMEISGDISTLVVVPSKLPHSTLYGPHPGSSPKGTVPRSPSRGSPFG